MTTLKHKTGRVLALVLAGAALASCTAHGQGRRLDPQVYVNYTPYSEAFYRELMTGRVNLYEGLGSYRNVVSGQVYASDGTLVECSARRRGDGKLHWLDQSSTRWSIVKRRAGALIEWDKRGGHKGYASKFYDPESGGFTTEILLNGAHVRSNPGVIQDTWPRLLADACPGLKLPAHIRINEKQTSQRMDELRRQDPDAPIRHFPGSHLTAPGRTGLGASRGAPTTTKEEVLSFVKAQNGNIVLSASEAGYVLVAGRALAEDGVWTDEVWRLDDMGTLAAYGVLRTESDAGGQEWVIAESPGYPEFRYPIGYPFPLLPTGHRHPAFQLSDHLIGSGKPHPLHFMGAAYADSRFVFTGNGLLSVVDRQGELAAGEGFEGTWRWTQGRLEVRIAGDGQARSIAWQDLAAELGLTPSVWTPSTPDRH